MIKYPSTEQLRNIAYNVKRQAQYVETLEDGTVITDENAILPTLKFIGTTKLHGTQGAATKTEHEIYPQSRSNVLTTLKDNAGFAQFVNQNLSSFEKLFFVIKTRNNLSDETITIYGEWAGKGIQKGVGIAELPKAFYIFGIKITPKDISDEKPAYWVDYSGLRDVDNKIYNIKDFKTFEIEIDFNDISKSQNKIVEMVQEVEDRCPVASYFLPDEDNLIGEGIVFETEYRGTRLNFKAKGEKHSKSRVKTIKKLTPEELEKLSKADKCSEEIFSIQRCNQALTEIFGVNFEDLIDIKKMGEYLKWVSQDTIKEELDVIQKYDLEIKDVIKKVQEKAKRYFLGIYNNA